MKRYIKIYWRFFKNSVMILMSHRFNFIMAAVASIVWTLGQVFSLKFISEKINDYQGWDFGALILLLGFGQILVYSMMIIYEGNLSKLTDKIIAGELDVVLLKPMNIKFALSFENVSIAQIIPTCTTIIPLIAYGLSSMEGLTYLNVFQAFFINLIALFIFYFLCLGFAGFSFFTEDARFIKETVVNGSMDLNRVPLNILPNIIGYFMTFAVPVAFATFYPVMIIKNEAKFINVLGSELLVLTAMYLFSRVTWKVGLKRYSGAG